MKPSSSIPKENVTSVFKLNSLLRGGIKIKFKTPSHKILKNG